MSPQRESASAKRDEIEAWWALIARVLAFVFGMVMVAIAALTMNNQPGTIRGLVAMGGFACMGPVIAASMAQIVGAARGTNREP